MNECPTLPLEVFWHIGMHCPHLLLHDFGAILGVRTVRPLSFPDMSDEFRTDIDDCFDFLWDHRALVDYVLDRLCMSCFRGFSRMAQARRPASEAPGPQRVPGTVYLSPSSGNNVVIVYVGTSAGTMQLVHEGSQAATAQGWFPKMEMESADHGSDMACFTFQFPIL